MRLRATYSNRALTWSSLSVTCVLCLTLAACGLPISGANSAPPPGWTDITPPDSRQNAVYAVSPDTPGLILAIIGGYSQTSAGAPPLAQLWRSTNGGSSWQSLNSLSVRSGTQLVMPPGGKGLVFAHDPLDSAILVSANAGQTWRALPSTSASDTAQPDEWTWLSGSVAVGTRLFAGGVAPGWGGLASGAIGFSESDDHGFTWRPIEVASDPAGKGKITQAIAPLDATGLAWLRLVAQGSVLSPMGSNLPPRIAIERSNDGGVAWRALSQTPQVAGDLIGAQLSSDTTHPGRVCAAFTTNNQSSSPGDAFKGGAAMTTRGPPAPLPLDISLFATGDSGASWSGGVVTRLRRMYGDALSPGVRMGIDGACYLAVAQVGSPIGAPTDVHGTLWRLPHGASAASSVFTMTDRELRMLFIAPGASGAPERVIALTRISGPGDGEPISCGQGCETYRDAGAYRLIWEPLPPA